MSARKAILAFRRKKRQTIGKYFFMPLSPKRGAGPSDLWFTGHDVFPIARRSSKLGKDR